MRHFLVAVVVLKAGFCWAVTFIVYFHRTLKLYKSNSVNVPPPHKQFIRSSQFSRTKQRKEVLSLDLVIFGETEFRGEREENVIQRGAMRRPKGHNYNLSSFIQQLEAVLQTDRLQLCSFSELRCLQKVSKNQQPQLPQCLFRGKTLFIS